MLLRVKNLTETTLDCSLLELLTKGEIDVKESEEKNLEIFRVE